MAESQNVRITIPVEHTVSTPQMNSICEQYGCKCNRVNGEWNIWTDNPVNLFWLGMNFNNALSQYPVKP